MNNTIIKLSIITILLACIQSVSFSNDNVTYKDEIDLTFSKLKLEDDLTQLNDIRILQLTYNRLVYKFLGVGGYFGTGMYDEWVIKNDYNSTYYEYTRHKYSAHYGINAKIHLLHLIFKTNISRFDLYASSNIGLTSTFTSSGNNIRPLKGHYFDYSLFGGASLFITKKVGLLVEAGYKEFRYNKGYFTKYGLTYRF